MWRAFWLVGTLICLTPMSSAGQEPALPRGQPTIGGKQFWSDELVYHEWRVQRHVLTGHCRLLDELNRRHASGAFETCQTELARWQRELGLPPLRGPVVIVLHGTGRTRNSMSSLCRFLQRSGGYTSINVSYASTRGRIEEHAQSLASVVEHLGPEVTEINFVAHSMGNLVIRHYLGDCTDAERGRQPDPRIHRIVMLGPPNNGTQMAARVQDNSLFKLLWGDSGVQMASQWAELAPRLATPACEFGIIAGGKGDGSGSNPLVDGDDDLVVSVAETRLPGARDMLVVPTIHSFLMADPDVQQHVLRFLENGYFRSEEERQPVPLGRRRARSAKE